MMVSTVAAYSEFSEQNCQLRHSLNVNSVFYLASDFNYHSLATLRSEAVLMMYKLKDLRRNLWSCSSKTMLSNNYHTKNETC